MSKESLGDYVGAIKDYNKAKNTEIENESNYFSAYQLSGISKTLLKDYKGAIIEFNGAIQIDSAVSDFMAMNSNMGEPTYHKIPNVLSAVFVDGANYSVICLGTYGNKYVKFRLSSDDSVETYKFHCIQDSTGAFCSFFN